MLAARSFTFCFFTDAHVPGVFVRASHSGEICRSGPMISSSLWVAAGDVPSPKETGAPFFHPQTQKHSKNLVQYL